MGKTKTKPAQGPVSAASNLLKLWLSSKSSTGAVKRHSKLINGQRAGSPVGPTSAAKLYCQEAASFEHIFFGGRHLWYVPRRTKKGLLPIRQQGISP